MSTEAKSNIENKDDKFVLRLDSSQMEEYLNCPLSWYYRYYENLRHNMSRRKDAVNKGTLIHRLLEVFYRELGKGASRSRAARIAQDKFTQEDWSKEFGLQQEASFLKMRFSNYVAHYDGDDLDLLKDEKGETGVEVGFSKILRETDQVLFIVEGRFDGITQINNAQAWVDHKTQGRMMDLYNYCPQFLTYAWATGYEWGIINYIRMHQEYDKKKTFKKALIYFPKHIVQDWEYRMLKIFFEIREVFYEPTLLFQRFWNLRRPNNCAGPFKSNPCQYCHLCEIDPRDKILLDTVKASNYTKVAPWQPWSQEEEEE